MASIDSAKPDRAQLEICESKLDGGKLKAGDVMDTVHFDFNPKDFSVSLQAGWNFKPQKKSAETPEFTGNQPRAMTVEVFLDATDQELEKDRPRKGDVSKDVELLFSCLQPTEKSLSEKKPLPPLVIFSWGKNRFTGVVKSVNATYKMFDPQGVPLRASAKVSLQEFRSAFAKQNPTSGGLRARRSHEVVLGDTLMSVAYREYGNPTWWRALAHVNGIKDPFSLRPGTSLLVPPAEDAEVMS